MILSVTLTAFYWKSAQHGLSRQLRAQSVKRARRLHRKGSVQIGRRRPREYSACPASRIYFGPYSETLRAHWKDTQIAALVIVQAPCCVGIQILRSCHPVAASNHAH